MPNESEPVRLVEGEALATLRTMPDGCASLVATDPPYGIEYHHGGQAEGGRSAAQVEWRPIIGDDRPNGDWLPEVYRVMREGAALYLCTRWDVEPEWRRLLGAAGFRVVQRLTWHKRVGGKGDLEGTFAPTTEDVLFASKGRHRLTHRPPSLLDVGCVPTWEHRHHPHQKPVALPVALVGASSSRGDVVLDPFMGSGTTGVACVQTGRRFIGVELDPAHYATARKRIEAALGIGGLFPPVTPKAANLFAG